MMIVEILAWLEGTSLGVLVRESPYGFPVLVGIHILGLIPSVGVLLWMDLRLLGLSLQRVPVPDLYRALAPWFLAGFAVMVVSGSILFAGFASAAYGNGWFRIKMAMLVLAAVNALMFHFVLYASAARRESGSEPGALARVAGLTSLVLWGAVIVCGRTMSYTMF